MSDAVGTLNLVNTGISALPACGLTCIQKLPEWVQPLTMDAINGVCKNIQADVNQFASCVGSGCTNATERTTCFTVVGLIPTACQSLGFNTTGVVVPKAPVATAAATTAATTTTKSGSAQIYSFGIIASAVAIATLLF
ncbi:hypothetical protein BDR26DRAFT_929738 [Obelidium mucronatum]|nr:hypothetical protein BDR26DRAFT_929738 [Obelidium mucronatum]